MKTFLLIFILALGFFLRAQETLSGNFLFLKDQGRDMLAVKSIVIDRKPTLIGPYTGLQGVFQGPLYYYALAVPFALSGGNPTVIMWFMLLSNLAAIPIIYVVGKRLFSQNVGLFAAFLLAVSPAAVAAATFIWSPFLVLPIASAALYFLLKKSLIPLAVCLGLLFHFEIAFAVPFTIVVILLLRKSLSLWFFIIIGIFLSPLMIFDFRHDFLTTRSLLILFSGGNQGLGGGEVYSKIVFDHFIRFFLNIKAAFIEHKVLSEVFSFSIILSATGYTMFSKSKQIKTLLMIPVLLFSIYLLYPFQIWDWYLVGLFPGYILLGSIFFHKFRWFIIMMLIYFSFIKLQTLYAYPDYGGTSKIKGKIGAIQVIYEDANGAPFSLRVFTPVVLTDAYDYLVWWYGNKTYGYLPTDSNIMYLLIEPDPGKPWTYKGWLETQVQVGKIIKTWELPSGFIIQKREV